MARAGAVWRSAASLDPTALVDAARTADVIAHNLAAEGPQEDLHVDLAARLPRSGRPLLACPGARPFRGHAVLVA